MLEKIMKRLKRFSLSELELIADCDCKMAVCEFIGSGKLKTCGDFYEYIEPKAESLKIMSLGKLEIKEISFHKAVEIFLEQYVEPNCKIWTKKTYISIFKTNILPYFKNQNLNDLDLDTVLEFYDWLKRKCLSDLRTKNTMALLNQLVHYFQDLGVIDRRCEFKVQRLDSRKSKLRNVI